MATWLMILIYLKVIVGCSLCIAASIIIGMDLANHKAPFLYPKGSRITKFKTRMLNALQIFSLIAYPVLVFKWSRKRLSTVGSIICSILSLVFWTDALVFIILWCILIVLYNVFMICFEKID